MAATGIALNESVAHVANVIRRAAQATGASFDYLLGTAKVESNLNPNVKATTSSATGLFQFIEQTWLATVKRAGPALGYGQHANAISQAPDGSYTVDSSKRAEVLNLRRDPAANAAMAAAFTQQNAVELRGVLGRPPSSGELYMAHFLGSTGAAKLIVNAASKPNTSAAELFPAAAKANSAIFYDQQGKARGAGDVYMVLERRFQTARTHALALAGAMPGQPGIPAPGAASDPAGTFDAFAMLSAVPVAPAAETGPAFHSLFQTGGRRHPISPLLGAIWGGNAAPASEPPASDPAPEPRRLAIRERIDLRDLYQNGRSNVRGLFDGAS